MKIQSANINNYPKIAMSKEISCGHKSAYSYLKNVPGNHCACCGREMIPSKDISTIWGKITRPLTALMNEGRYNFAETAFPPIYKVLTKFAEKYPEESLDSIVSKADNHFEFMNSIADSFREDEDYKTLSGLKQQKAIKSRTMDLLRISSAVLKNASEVVENLKPLKHYLHDYRKDILEDFELWSVVYPDKKLNEIIKMPEVAEKYIEKTYEEAVEFAEIRDKHWNKANKIILDKSPKLEIPLNKLYEDVCLIYRGIIDPQKVSYEIQNAYEKFLDKYKLSDIKQAVLDEIIQMPTSLFSKNSFLSFARRYYNDGEIVNYVVKPFMESVEHIDAISAGGTNASSNIIVMCRICNLDRKNYSYTKLLAIHPEMINNTEKQIKFYADRILSGEIPAILEKYPIEVAKTLYRCSEGLMDYDLDYYIKALAEKHKLNQ